MVCEVRNGVVVDDPHTCGGQNQGGGVNAGFDKYCDGWPSVRLMNSIAQKYVDEANAKCEEEGNLRAEAEAKAKAAEEARVIADAKDKDKAKAEEANVLAAKAKAAEEAKLAAEAEAMAEKEAKLNTEDGNHVWGVNTKDEIYYRAPHSGSWERIHSGLKNVSVSDDGNHIWGFNASDAIYYRAPHSGS
jgi:hypothetical protein